MGVVPEEIPCGLDVSTRVFTRAHEAEVVCSVPLAFSAHGASRVGEWGTKYRVAED